MSGELIKRASGGVVMVGCVMMIYISDFCLCAHKKILIPLYVLRYFTEKRCLSHHFLREQRSKIPAIEALDGNWNCSIGRQYLLISSINCGQRQSELYKISALESILIVFRSNQ